MRRRETAEYGDTRLPNRLWDKIYPCPITGCWLWGGATSTHGYGKASTGLRRGHSDYIHRIVYAALVGPIADQIDHRCRQRACCNPEHLDDVPALVNLHRSANQINDQRTRTRCPLDHPLAGDNLYLVVTPSGRRKRDCRTCRRRRTAESDTKRRAAR